MKVKKTKESRLKEFSVKPKKALWTLAVPILAGMAIQTVYTIAFDVFCTWIKYGAWVGCNSLNCTIYRRK